MADEQDTGEDFDFDASTNQAWELFSGRLAEVISVIDDGENLRLGTLSGGEQGATGSPELVFTCLPRPARELAPTILAEASGNAMLGMHDQIGPEQIAVLGELGWHEPTVAPRHQRGSYWLEHEQDECTWLADKAVATLREVYGVQHPVFLAPDHLAEVLQPDGLVEEASTRVETLGEHDGLARMPSSRAQLDEWITAEVTHMFGHEPIRDSEGDIAIRVGSTMVFVRSSADFREVVLFSALVHEVEGRSRAAEVLNDLNAESRFGRFAIHRDRVYVTMSLLARPFVPAHLHEGVAIISQIADGIDDELAAKLRGRTTFVEGE